MQKTRALSAYGLAELGEPARDAAPQLRRTLQDDNVLVRFHAARALWKTANDARAAFGPLQQALSDEDSPLALMAVHVLITMADEHVPAKAALTHTLDHAKPAVRRAAAEGLARLARTDPALVAPLWRALSDADAGVRSVLRERLGKMPQPPYEAVPAIIEQTKSADPATRAIAYRALGLVGELPSEGTAALLRGLKEPLPRVRDPVYQSLYQLRLPADLIVPAVIAAMDDEKVNFADDPSVYKLRGILAALREQAAPVVPAIVRGIAGGRVDEKLVTLLNNHREATAQSLPVLIEALADQRQEVRLTALLVLSYLGPAGKDAVPALIRLLNEPQRRPQPAGGEQFGPAGAAIPSAAARALGSIGPDAGAAVPALAAKLADPSLGHDAGIALGKIGPEALEVLTSALQRPEAGARLAAAHGLGAMEPEAATAALPKLKLLLDDPAQSVRLAAAGTLRAIEEDPARLLPVLKEALGSDLQFIRTAKILGKMGPAANSLAPQLIDALKNRSTSYAAMDALRRMGELPPEARARIEKELDEFVPSVREPMLQILTTQPRGLERYLEAMQHPEQLDKSDAQLGRRMSLVAGGIIERRNDLPLPLLSRALELPDPHVRVKAAAAIWKTTHKLDRIVPVLAQLLDDGLERAEAIRVLNSIGAPAKGAVAALHRMLDDDKPLARYLAADSLWRLEKDPEPIVPVVLRVADDPKHRDSAHRLLRSMGHAAIPFALAQLESDDSGM